VVAGDVVPTPTFPAKYAFPVVVAPPAIVRPPVWVPEPIVEEAYAVKPPLNCVRVDVAFPVSAKGYPIKLVMTPVELLYEMPAPPERDVEDTLLLKTVQSAEERQPRVEPFAVVHVTFPFAYERAPEKVVVAPEYTRPVASTASPPAESEERRSEDVRVEEAAERKPFVKPTVVEVATP
jgi:hypothetical protein